MRRILPIAVLAVISIGCGFDAVRTNPPSTVVSPVISQPALRKAQLDAMRREAATHGGFAEDDRPGTARVSSPGNSLDEK